jgi:hypothetical protein
MLSGDGANPATCGHLKPGHRGGRARENLFEALQGLGETAGLLQLGAAREDGGGRGGGGARFSVGACRR